MTQMVQENKSLWRIKNQYTADAIGHPECQTFFQKLTDQKEAVVSELTDLIKMEMNKIDK